MMRTIPLLTFVSLMAPALGIAQPPPTFEVDSIKPNKHGGGPYLAVSAGRLMMTYYSIQELVAFAYGVRTEQVVGRFPSERYDIEALTDSAVSGKHMTGPMLRALLADRFALRVRKENRDLPVYDLTVAEGGLKMSPSQGDCSVSDYDRGATPTDAQSADPVFYCDHPRFGAQGVNRTLAGKGITLQALCESLSRTELNRTVVDKTGLIGSFDLTLKWVADPKSPSFDGFGGPKTSEADPGPPLFTALQEQLGLRVQAGRGPVEVFVVDNFKEPAP